MCTTCMWALNRKGCCEKCFVIILTCRSTLSMGSCVGTFTGPGAMLPRILAFLKLNSDINTQEIVIGKGGIPLYIENLLY